MLSEFEPGRVLEVIEQERISKLFIVPAAMRLCLQHPRCAETDFSSIETMLYGASPIPTDLLREAIAVFKCGFAQLYGMTETTGTATYLPPGDHDPMGQSQRMKSAGKPLPGVRVKVVGEDGTPFLRTRWGDLPGLAGEHDGVLEPSGGYGEKRLWMALCTPGMRAIWTRTATFTCTIG